jgi:5-methylcytosine-specific restriction endonuclease McrA
VKKHAAIAYRKTGGYCWYCGADLIERRITVDHRVPRSKGGTKVKENIYPACYDCNQAKGSMDIEEYRRTLDRKTFWGETRGY